MQPSSDFMVAHWLNHKTLILVFPASLRAITLHNVNYSVQVAKHFNFASVQINITSRHLFDMISDIESNQKGFY